jgi:hypothetical protein
MDKIIAAVLETVITTYPLDAPESKARPYATYETSQYDEAKALSGYLTLTTLRYEVDIVADTIGTCKEKHYAMRNALKNIEQTTQGGQYIEQVTLDSNAPELWEEEIQAYRKILTFEISYNRR